MKASIEQIKELREMTGAGISAVKEALESSSSQEEAIKYLREKGLAKAVKRAGKEAENGVIGVYIHTDSRLAVLVEVATETDFAAKSEVVKKFANDVALHIAAMNTEYVSKEVVPAEIVEQEKAAAKEDVAGKPAEIAEKILQGKLDRFYKDVVLTEQQLFTDETKTVGDYINEIVAQIGEKTEVTRFVRVQIAKPTVSCNLI